MTTTTGQISERDRELIEKSVAAMNIDSWPGLSVQERLLVRRALSPILETEDAA